MSSSKEEIFFVEVRDSPDCIAYTESPWAYQSRHHTAKAAHRARKAMIRKLRCNARQVRVVHMMILTTIKVMRP